MDIVERLRFDATRCELQFSVGVASNIEEAVITIEQLADRIYTLEAALKIADDSIRHHLRGDHIAAAMIQPHAVKAIRDAVEQVTNPRR